MSLILWFSGCLKYALSDGVLKSKVIFEADFDQKSVGYIGGGKCQIWVRSKNFELNIPFERAHSKLSEYHKIIEIGSTEVELWPLKVIVFSQMTVVWGMLREEPPYYISTLIRWAQITSTFRSTNQFIVLFVSKPTAHPPHPQAHLFDRSLPSSTPVASSRSGKQWVCVLE